MSAETWATIADLGTALGTLVLAVATFSAVRSGNRTARAAEQSLLTSLRPLLMQSKLSDESLKVNFGDNKWVMVPAGTGVAQIGGGDGTMGPADGVLYFVLSLRNVGNGIAVLHGWRVSYERAAPSEPMPSLTDFTLQTRDLYIPAGDIGFWQGAIRDFGDPRTRWPARSSRAGASGSSTCSTATTTAGSGPSAGSAASTGRCTPPPPPAPGPAAPGPAAPARWLRAG